MFFAKFLKTTAAAAMTLALASGTMAATYTVRPPSDGGTQLWNSTSAWRVGGSNVATIPGTGDDVVIDFNIALNATANGVARTLDVDPGVTLSIDNGFALTISNVGNATSPIDGTIEVKGNNSRLITSSAVGDHFAVGSTGAIKLLGQTPTLTLNTANAVQLVASGSSIVIDTDSGSFATFDGSGSVQGLDNNAQIRINATKATQVDLFIDTSTTVHGALKIMQGGGAGVGLLDNEGAIKADSAGGGVLLIDSSASVVDASGPARWQSTTVSGTRAVLRFEANPSGLAGDFSVGGQTLFQASVATSGTLSLPKGGQIVVATSMTFSYGAEGLDPCNVLPSTGSPPFVLAANTYTAGCP